VTKNFLAILALFFSLTVQAAEKWTVPQSVCPNYATANTNACVGAFFSTWPQLKDSEPGKKNVEGICLTAGAVAQNRCEKGQVVLDRSNVTNFCADLVTSYGENSRVGCELVVKDSANDNPPEENSIMLQLCKELEPTVAAFSAIPCVKRFKERGLPPSLKPDPEPKAAPAKPKNRVFKPGEETSV